MTTTVQDSVIIIDDDEDVDFEITGWSCPAPHQPPTVALTPRKLPSCVSLLDLSDDDPLYTTAQPPSSSPVTERSSFNLHFQTPNYNQGPRNSCPSRQASSARSPRQQKRQESLPSRGPPTFTGPAAITHAVRSSGTAVNPIVFDAEITSLSKEAPMARTSDSGSNASSPKHPQGETIDLSLDMPDAPLTPPVEDVAEKQDPVLEKDLAQTVHDLEVVDLDELEDDAEDELRILDALPKPQAKSRGKSLQIPRRNPSITAPWVSKSSFQHENMLLKPNKTVELNGGDFLRITHIIVNSETTEVRIRGNIFQRTKDLNGLLERKMNEVLMYLEVDLDDSRPHMEQSASEFSLAEIKKIRSLRFTNQQFPLDRNMNLTDFQDRAHPTGDRPRMLLEGGLTCRWKYTCIYANAAERYGNNHTERRLERFRFAECMSKSALPDAERRSEWRGETILGGAHRPTILTTESQLPPAMLKPAILIDDPPTDEEGGLRSSHSHILGSSSQHLHGSTGPQMMNNSRIQKRRRDDDESIISFIGREKPKRIRLNGEAGVEETRQRLATATLQKDTAEIVELSLGGSSKKLAKPKNPPPYHIVDLDQPRTSITNPIDLLSSELSTPPPAGTIPHLSLVSPTPIDRLPGQKLTYGDAFCGGGGSTRGAVMAGLQVKWGFDFNPHAHTTWTANFPQAVGYLAEAHAFVSGVQNSSQKHLFKVDILHLSPPCQFFSPAHTVEGRDDEMNIASLFAVQSVIEVSRPRIVTLEQTFGITNERFRWFFNSLVHMFTSHEFSMRWAVVPLQSWGLPQRRMRLIIIASCPGEILPKMPPATHGDPGSNLKPLVSVNSILESIPDNAPDHNPQSVIFHKQSLTPWDGTKILPRAMTTSGGQNYHPSGKRDFTLREYACLQGFPENHVFRGSCVKKQIGNAVPALVAKVLFESIRKELDAADGIVNVEVLE